MVVAARVVIAAGMVAATAASACAAGGSREANWSGARQAAPRGAAVYDRECGSCHGKVGDGSRGIPGLVGPGALPLRDRDRQPLRTARDLYAYVSTAMPLPPKKVGTLSSEDYWAVVDFIIRAQGIDVPARGVSPANADEVRIN